MKQEDFNKAFADIMQKCEVMLCAKNAEYARGDDKLHNFKKAAPLAPGRNQEAALAGMMLKHTVSVYDMVDDIGKGNHADISKWEEKVVDHINYLILLYAMIVERGPLYQDTGYREVLVEHEDFDPNEGREA
jgi:hypothetical protein